MKLTKRQELIIKIILEYKKPVTVLEISDKLDISKRTVLRELPFIEDWFLKNSLNLTKKPGVGLFIDDKDKAFVLEILSSSSIEIEYTRDERRRIILSELLENEEGFKSYYLTSKLKISEGTLSTDITNATKWISKNKIEVLRKPGVGIALLGTENHLRKAVLRLFYENLTEGEILKLLENQKNQKIYSDLKILDFIDLDVKDEIKNLLRNLEKELFVKYTDSAYISIVIYVLLMSKRIRNSKLIKVEREQYFKISLLPEYFLAKEITNALEKILKISITTDETTAVAIHLMSLNIWIKDKHSASNFNNINIKQLVMTMMLSVEKDVSVSFRDNNTLLDDLTKHMKPMISRLVMQIKLKNSQLDMLKTNYSEMFEATRRALNIVKTTLGIDEIPESEIGFVAMHFCVASEHTKLLDRKIRAVIVCPMGIATSKMLAVKLKNEFKNIEVFDVISALEIDVDKLYREQVDIIISTVKLDVNFLNLTVEPILTFEDKKFLEDIVKQIVIKNKKATDKIAIVSEEQSNPMTKANISYIKNLSEEIIKTIESISVFRRDDIFSIDDLLERASYVFTKDEQKKNLIKSDLKKRENVASTFIDEYSMYFLHCKTKGVDHASFSYIKILNDFLYDDKPVLGAIIMIVPDGENTNLSREIISAISSNIIENESFFNKIKSAKLNDISREIEIILGRLYKNILREKMED